MAYLDNFTTASIRLLSEEEMNLIAGGSGPGDIQGGVWDGGLGNGGCIPIPGTSAD